MGKSKSQQIQFFKDCLIPQYDISADRIDFKAYVDSELSTSENWENIKSEYGLEEGLETSEVEFMEQKIKHLANRVDKLEIEVEELRG